MAVPHQLQRWKTRAPESAAWGSRTPVAEPPAGRAELPEWWYTLVNSLRSAGIRMPGSGRAHACPVHRATVHADRVWHSVPLVKALRTPNLRQRFRGTGRISPGRARTPAPAPPATAAPRAG